MPATVEPLACVPDPTALTRRSSDVPLWRTDGGGYESDAAGDSGNPIVQPFQPLGGAMMDDWWEKQKQSISTSSATPNPTAPAFVTAATSSPLPPSLLLALPTSIPAPTVSPAAAASEIHVDFLPAAAVPSFSSPLATYLPAPLDEDQQSHNAQFQHQHHIECYRAPGEANGASSVDGTMDYHQDQHDDAVGYATFDERSSQAGVLNQQHLPASERSIASDLTVPGDDDHYSSASARHRRNVGGAAVPASTALSSAVTTTTSSSSHGGKYPHGAASRQMCASIHSAPSFDMESSGRLPVDAVDGDGSSPRRGSTQHRGSSSTYVASSVTTTTTHSLATATVARPAGSFHLL
jgi:hypothetical protein